MFGDLGFRMLGNFEPQKFGFVENFEILRNFYYLFGITMSFTGISPRRFRDIEF